MRSLAWWISAPRIRELNQFRDQARIRSQAKNMAGMPGIRVSCRHMGTRRCIYCLANKPESQFNREHVIPEAFGVFQQNLVLDCVCQACNDFFGRDLDLKLGRDTIEGLDRFRYGLKTPAQYKGLGRRRLP